MTYFKKLLEEHSVDITKNIAVPKTCTLDLDHKSIIDFAERNRVKATRKWYHPRPFLDDHSNRQMINANWIGYNEHNTQETNWGLDPEHNKELNSLIGRANFDLLGIDPDNVLVRLLEYKPGQMLPLHSDGMEGFRKIYGKDNPRRFFVAVSDWDWGHVLQAHNNVISHWKTGDTWEIKPGVWHCSANFGIANKYTFTITGVSK
jgi:hypothetical protein